MLSINSEIQSTKDLKQFLKMSILLKGLWHATRKHEITYNAEKKTTNRKGKTFCTSPYHFSWWFRRKFGKRFLEIVKKKKLLAKTKKTLENIVLVYAQHEEPINVALLENVEEEKTANVKLCNCNKTCLVENKVC